jgi:hypothetical protein
MTRRKRIKFWVLKDGRNYFKQWTGIGPAATQRREEAARFWTKRDAMMSPAFTFALTFYEPHPVRDD